MNTGPVFTWRSLFHGCPEQRASSKKRAAMYAERLLDMDRQGSGPASMRAAGEALRRWGRAARMMVRGGHLEGVDVRRVDEHLESVGLLPFDA